MRRPEHNLLELVLSFHVGPGDCAQVFRFGSNLFYSLSHPTSPSVLFLYCQDGSEREDDRRPSLSEVYTKERSRRCSTRRYAHGI